MNYRKWVLNPLCLTCLFIFGITVAQAQGTKGDSGGRFPNDARSRTQAPPKSMEPLQSIVKNPYMDQTEKNLPNHFKRAEKSDTTLVFEESDDLFGREPGTPDTNDDED